MISSLLIPEDYHIVNYEFQADCFRLGEVAGPPDLGGLGTPSLGVAPHVCSNSCHRETVFYV